MTSSRIAIGATLLCLATTTAWATPPVTVATHWFRYLLSSIPAGGYMKLENTTNSPIRLTGARSSACGMTMLHHSVARNGVDQMLPVKSIVIPAHGTFEFQPGHYHVMCMKPHMKPGTTVPVTLEFAHTPPITVNFTVYGADGKPDTK